MLDEHAFLLGDGLEQRVKSFFIGALERPQFRLEPSLSLMSFGNFWSSSSSDITLLELS
jgi:hypothetical protein